MDSFLGDMITARLKLHVFPGGYDYRSVEVNGTEYTDVVVPLIYMAAGLQMQLVSVYLGTWRCNNSVCMAHLSFR